MTTNTLGQLARAVFGQAGLIIMMITAATACACIGVSMLLGQAWALITAACILFLLAGLIMRGATHA